VRSEGVTSGKGEKEKRRKGDDENSGI